METAYGVYIHPEELDAFWISAAEKAEIRFVALHPVGGETAAESFALFLNRLEQPSFQETVKGLRQAGIRVETAAHALSYLLPRPLFADRPDWFRMNEKGERTPDFNLCPSSEEYGGAKKNEK